MTNLTVSAPAKINLFLHVTGKREDGYHLLDSLVVFADDVADVITIDQTAGFSLTVSGPFSKEFKERDLSIEEDSTNLVVRAARLYAKETGTSLAYTINLEKNLPLGAGLGGGSADAAAVIKALEKIHGAPVSKKSLMSLGADVPVCYEAHPCRFSGTGEIIASVPALPTLYGVLIWPGHHSSTKDVFAKRPQTFRTDKVNMPEAFGTLQQFIAFLEETGNDLAIAAENIHPSIRIARKYLENIEDCLLARMTGSGSSVFGMFDSEILCRQAAFQAKEENPSWWVRTATI